MPNVLSRTLSSLFLPFSQDQANSVWIIGARGNNNEMLEKDQI